MAPSLQSANDDSIQRLVGQYTEITRLVGGLAHEIKNPLSTIRMNMELLAEDFCDSDSARDRRALKKVELVQGECTRLQELLDNFLRFSKANRLDLKPHDISIQLREALDFYRPQASESNVEIVDYLATNLPTVMLDREAFRGALLNLLLNAEQAMPDGGQLVVRTYGTAEGVALDLIDNGVRHGRTDPGEGFRGLLYDQTRRVGAWPIDRQTDHRWARRPDQSAKRARPGYESHHRPARLGTASRRRRLGEVIFL